MSAERKPRGHFDAVALYEAMDAQRVARGLSWRQAADEIWDLSAVLNRRRQDHPISPSTLTGLADRGDCTCQHALFFLRWLGRSPESFVSGSVVPASQAALPVVGAEHRLRWDLKALSDALNARRQEQGLTWAELARQLGCTDHQLTGLKTARFAIGMRLAMKIVQWLDRPAAAFIYPAEW